MSELRLAGELRQVHVTYRRQVSDGNYGTEMAECYLEWYVEPEEDAQTDQEFAQEMLKQAHDIVHVQLRASGSGAVRKAVEVRTTAPLRGREPPGPDDLEELPF